MSNETPSTILRKFLYDLRQEHGLTQKQLAHKAGLAYAKVGKFERGEAIPGTVQLCQLAEVLGQRDKLLKLLDDVWNGMGFDKGIHLHDKDGTYLRTIGGQS